MSVMQVGKWARGVALPPDWWVPKADGRTLDLNLDLGQIWDDETGVRPMAALTRSRPSGRGRRNPLGVWGALVDNEIGVDHDDAGTALGLQIEPQATYNRVNSSLTGLVAGSPGTAPDGWSISAPGGLTRTLSLVTTSGRPKLRVHYAGAPSSNTQILLQTIPSLTLAAASGQVWTYGARFSCGGTGLDGNSLALNHWETDGSNNILRSGAVGGTSPLAHARRSSTVTIGASTAYLRLLFGSGIITAGTTCDFWIEVECPTLTQTAFLPSEYLVGTSSAVRYADGVSTSITGLISVAEGGLYIDCQPIDSGAVQILAQIDDGTNSNKVLVHRWSDDVIYAEIYTAGVSQGSLTLGAHTGGDFVKVALGWAANSFAGRKSGGSLQTDASVTPPSGLTTLRLGSGVSIASPLNGHLRRVSAFPTRAIMSNTKIGELVA